MTRRILLHVGSPKCGSTYLQQVMLRNAPTLLSHGIRYPHDGGSHPGNAATIHLMESADYQEMFADGIHTVILSHEDLYSLSGQGKPLAALAQADSAQVHIVAFIRPFSEFIFGDYSQFMKQFFDTFLKTRTPYNGQSFQDFALHRIKTLQPANFLRNWQKCFGGAPMTVDSNRAIRPVLTELLGPDIPINWNIPHDQSNPSLRMIDCDRIAAAMRDPEVTNATIRAMFRDAFNKTDEPDPGRSDERKTLIEEAFAPQNKALRDHFGFDNTLPGFPPTL